MLQNKIFRNYIIEIFKTFFTIIVGFSLIALTVRAVNFLELIVDNGYSVLTYFKYSILNVFGIAPKFFPLAFLISILIFLVKHINNNEFIILWTTGVKKIVLVNLLLFASFLVMILYLIFSTFLTPSALNKSREILGQSQFNSFLPTIRSQQFSDSFKGLTFFVEKKVDNEIKSIFLHDTGNNLKNFSSSSSNLTSTTIIAESGIVEKKGLFLINGQIISNKTNKEENEIIKFQQLNIDLTKLTTTVIKDPKLQETSTIKLLSCYFAKNINSNFCRKEAIKEITPILMRRLSLPLYLPVLVLICSFLLTKKKNYLNNKILVISFSFFVLIFIELILKYTGFNSFIKLLYFIMPLSIICIIYPFLFYKFSR